jgi:hypothetical protein
VRAVAIVPEGPADGPPTAAQAAAFRAFYLAGYEAAKREDKNLLMLGAGTAQATLDYLGGNLAAYLDAVAVTDAALQPLLVQRSDAFARRPLWVLPPTAGDAGALAPPIPPAAALTAGAVVAPLPPPAADRGATAHLLGGTVLLTPIHLAGAKVEELPFIAVFQGDGYAVAAVAGLSAGTRLDALFPTLARTRTAVEPVRPSDEPPYPNVEVSDDTHTMRVVDAAGAPVDCRVGDSVYVPAADRMTYVLQAGAAEDLAGSLRPAIANHMPLVSPSAAEAGPGAVVVRLTNIRTDELGGTVRLISPPGAGQDRPQVLGEAPFVPISPGKTLELSVEVAAPAPADRPLIVEITTPAARQRTAVPVERK